MKREKSITFGTGKAWRDAEADEAVFGKGQAEDDCEKVAWEQWAGVIERGRPDSLVLVRTTSSLTAKRAPGPGAIKKIDWKPLADRYLRKRHIILHTDRAKSYAMKVDGVKHDSVRHCKKRVKRGGKWIWQKPTYVRLVTHKLPDGSSVRTKGGTQVIDRAWRLIRETLKGRHMTPGAASSAAAVRSAQWLSWNRAKDLWLQTGAMMRANSWRT